MSLVENKRQRSHLLLIGDSLGDLSMGEGLEVDDINMIKIGFLNDREERSKQYLDGFDIVILGDPDFSIPLFILESINNYCEK